MSNNDEVKTVDVIRNPEIYYEEISENDFNDQLAKAQAQVQDYKVGVHVCNNEQPEGEPRTSWCVTF